MKAMVLMATALLLAATAVLTDYSFAQDEHDRQKAQPDRATSDTDAQVARLVQYAMPGERHKLLERMAGRWNIAIKYRMNSAAPVVKSQGTCVRKWILGGRFLLEEFDGGSLGLPYKGLAIYGYDSFAKKYTSAWLDTMSTAITTNLGSCQDACREISFEGRHGDPWTGVIRPSHGITRFVNENQHVLELHEPDNTGKEFKILEIVYTRP